MMLDPCFHIQKSHLKIIFSKGYLLSQHTIIVENTMSKSICNRFSEPVFLSTNDKVHMLSSLKKCSRRKFNLQQQRQARSKRTAHSIMLLDHMIMIIY